MISTLILPYPATRGDSRIGRIVPRVSTAEAVVGRASALVAFVAHSRFEPGDRTLLRLLASSFAYLLAGALRAARAALERVRPERAWPITPRIATPLCLSAVARTVSRVRAAHPLPYRAATAESPAVFARTVTDETRDSDQRDVARDASRHPRGRRAR